jgi:hypothetical protein
MIQRHPLPETALRQDVIVQIPHFKGDLSEFKPIEDSSEEGTDDPQSQPAREMAENIGSG